MVAARAEADSDFAQAAGDLANKYDHRMTLHPGQVCGALPVLLRVAAHASPSQFTQIGSPKQNVVNASIRELRCMCPDGRRSVMWSTTECFL